MSNRKITQAPSPITPLSGSGRITFRRNWKKPNYDHWSKKAYWTIEEAAYLLSGVKPKDSRLPARVAIDENQEKINDYYDLLKRAYDAGLLKEDSSFSNRIVPGEILKWATEIGIEVPAELRQGLKIPKIEIEETHEKQKGEPPHEIDDSFGIKKISISFYKNGDIWKIGECGKEKSFTHLKGFELLQLLLRHPGKDFNPLELFYKGKIPKEIKHFSEVTHQQLSSLSTKDRLRFVEEFETLQNKLNNTTDNYERKEIENEIDIMRDYEANGQYGFKLQIDKVRINCYKLLKTASEKIIKELPKLKEHFLLGKNCVINTAFNAFAYQGKPPVDWILD